MTTKEQILARVREALTITAPQPGSHGGHAPHPPHHGRPVEHAQPWLPPGGDSFEQQVERFRAASADLKTDFQLFANLDELKAALVRLRESEGWNRAALHRGELTDAAGKALGIPLLHTDGGYDVHAMEACDVGISQCDALVAQTGSVLVTSRSAGGRALSVLPPHHVVLARREQLVRDLSAALHLVKERYAPDYPSMISFITGPSRTGDIERILVLGAHGPKKLTVLCY